MTGDSSQARPRWRSGSPGTGRGHGTGAIGVPARCRVRLRSSWASCADTRIAAEYSSTAESPAHFRRGPALRDLAARGGCLAARRTARQTRRAAKPTAMASSHSSTAASHARPTASAHSSTAANEALAASDAIRLARARQVAGRNGPSSTHFAARPARPVSVAASASPAADAVCSATGQRYATRALLDGGLAPLIDGGWVQPGFGGQAYRSARRGPECCCLCSS